MTPKSQKEKLREALTAQVLKAQTDYHQKDAPTMADADYDALLKQLHDLEIELYGEVPKNSAYWKVGSAPKRGLYPVKHETPMLSLTNVFDIEALEAAFVRWDTPDYHVSFKEDGLACELRYRDGVLAEAATRGDRYVGESIYHNVRHFVPGILDDKRNLNIRGEIVMHNAEFKAYNERLAAAGKTEAINPRNAAAGVARRLDSKKGVTAQLVFHPYAVTFPDGDGPAEHSAALAQLVEYGFHLPATVDWDKNRDLADNLEHALKQRHTLPSGIDGLVFRVDNYQRCAGLGTTSSAPRWAVAYKFPPEERSTVVRNIRIQVGRTGNITPVAEVDPVEVGGVTVTNATLHNEDYIATLDLTIGDTVLIRRAGDVVPEIAAVMERPADRVKWVFPTVCTCGNPIVRKDGSANHVCTGGDNCPAQRQRAFEHFVSRNAMDIEGVGEVVIADLLASGRLKRFADIYRLTRADLTAVSSETSDQWVSNVLQAIERSKQTTFGRFLFAQGIPMVGQATAKRIADWFGRYSAFKQASAYLLQGVKDVGDSAALSIRRHLDTNTEMDELLEVGVVLTDEVGPDPEFAQYADIVNLLMLAKIKGVTPKKRDKIREMLETLGYPNDHAVIQRPDDPKWIEARDFFNAHAETLYALQRDWRLVTSNLYDMRVADTNAPLAGLTYVITGSFEDTMGLSRQSISEELQRLGAKVTGSVSAKTTAVFVGEGAGANKLDKAVALKIPVLYVNDLRDVLTKHSL